MSLRSGAGTDLSRRLGQVSCPYESEGAGAGGRNVAGEGSRQAWTGLALRAARPGPGGWPLRAPAHTPQAGLLLLEGRTPSLSSQKNCHVSASL